MLPDPHCSCRSHYCRHFLISPPPPRSTLFPYTTLFRSSSGRRWRRCTKASRLVICTWTPPRCSWCATRPSCIRSEEHTSELQSRFDLVCRLLLEKKKITSNSDYFR